MATAIFENMLHSPVPPSIPDILGLSAAETRAYLAPLGVPAAALDILERGGCTTNNLFWLICDNQPPAVHEILRQYDLQLGAIQTICEVLSAALPAALADNIASSCGGADAYDELGRGEVSAARPGSPTCSPPESPTNSPIRARSVATSSGATAGNSPESVAEPDPLDRDSAAQPPPSPPSARSLGKPQFAMKSAGLEALDADVLELELNRAASAPPVVMLEEDGSDSSDWRRKEGESFEEVLAKAAPADYTRGAHTDPRVFTPTHGSTPCKFGVDCHNLATGSCTFLHVHQSSETVLCDSLEELELAAVHNQTDVECVAEPDINLNANMDTERAPIWASPNARPVCATRKPKLSRKDEKKEEKKLRKANMKKPLELDSSAIRISSHKGRAVSPKRSQKAQMDAKHSEQAEQLRKQREAKQAEVQTTSSQKPLVDLKNGFGGLEQEGEADAETAAAAKQEADDTKKWARRVAEDKKAQSPANSEVKVVAAVSPKTKAALRMDRELEKTVEIKQLTEEFRVRKNEVSRLIVENRENHHKTRKAMVQLVEIVSKLEALDPSFEAGVWYNKTVRPKH